MKQKKVTEYSDYVSTRFFEKYELIEKYWKYLTVLYSTMLLLHSTSQYLTVLYSTLQYL